MSEKSIPAISSGGNSYNPVLINGNNNAVNNTIIFFNDEHFDFGEKGSLLKFIVSIRRFPDIVKSFKSTLNIDLENLQNRLDSVDGGIITLQDSVESGFTTLQKEIAQIKALMGDNPRTPEYLRREMAEIQAQKEKLQRKIALYENDELLTWKAKKLWENANKVLRENQFSEFHNLLKQFRTVHLTEAAKGAAIEAEEYYYRLCYEDALREIEEAVRITPDNPEYLVRLSEYANNLGQYEKALEAGKNALKIYEVSDPKGTNNAWAAISTGNAYRNLGNYQKALIYHQKAVDIREVFLPNHPSLAVSYTSLGIDYWKLGKYQKAISYHEKALAIDMAVLGKKDVRVAVDCGNLAIAYRKLGEYQEEFRYQKKAFDIKKASLPKNHPSLAYSYGTLADAYQSLGNYQEALRHQKKALDIRISILGKNHPRVGFSYTGFGEIYQSLKQYKKAIICHQKALAIDRFGLGDNHPYVAIDCSKLSIAFIKLGKYQKAIGYIQKALSIFEPQLGSSHPYTKEAKTNLAIAKSKLDEK